MNPLIEAFAALAAVQGEKWTLPAGAEFTAVGQDGASAAYNFADGNSCKRILRALSSELPALPKEGDILTSASGRTAAVCSAHRVDENFSEIEIGGITQ